MKTAVIQLRPYPGKIESNIAAHERALMEIAAHGVNLAVFPELSLTGYEPLLAQELALDDGDPRLSVLQKISNRFDMVVGVGAPIRKGGKIHIGLIFFRPNTSVLNYFKKYLHPDELPFFFPGENISILNVKQAKVAPAICYEVSCEEHRNAALAYAPTLYVASVAKFEKGMASALQTLQDLSRRSALPVMISNSIGSADNGICIGQSSVWDRSGNLLVQLGTEEEGYLIYDSQTDSASIHKLTAASIS